MRDMKMRDQIAGVENAGKVSMENQSVKKCLIVIVIICVQIYSFSVSLLDKWCETELYWIIGQDIDETTYDQLCRYYTGMPCYVWR